MSLSIEAKDLSLVFPLDAGQEKHAVDNVSLSVREGERIGIVGRNGAGKTSLLQMLASIAEPTAGQLHIEGRVNALLTLGMSLRDDLTGVENIHIDAEITGRTREQTEALIPDIVAFADLGAFIERPVRTYSTGMKARLAFSMLVHIDPEILIVDETLSVGDARFSEKATAKMHELTRRGRILLFVSHSMAAICDMCTRCIWMDDGKIRMDGAPQKVTAAYLEEVRTTDDAQLVRRFREKLVNESIRPDWAIGVMEFAESPAGPAVALPQTREPVVLRAEVRGPANADFAMSLSILRLDELIVCRSSSAGVRFSLDAAGKARIAADLGPLPLSQGIYAAELVTETDAGACARRSILFEVVNAKPHKGGVPILTAPTRITSERIGE